MSEMICADCHHFYGPDCPCKCGRCASPQKDKQAMPSNEELVERLNDEAMRLQGQGIDRGCVDSSLAGSLALEAADRIEELEAALAARPSAQPDAGMVEAMRVARDFIEQIAGRCFPDSEVNGEVIGEAQDALNAIDAALRTD